ncbi:DUF349 domain-containing protein, partial [Flavobacteriaceae bacterium]|nr:DUF349 domain-containing protein [Flavobacteriaceae bacterium]
MNKLVFLLILISNSVFAQDTYTINGHFPNFPKSSFELKGYEGFQEMVLLKTNSDSEGRFTLTYPADYVGFAQLDMNGAYSNLLFLNKENYSLFWEDLTKREDLQVSGSQEYDAFVKGMKTFQKAEAKLAGWHYLLPLYEKDSLKQYQITSELDIVNNLFPNYVKSLPEDVWVRQYLLTKGLIEQMPMSVKTYSWRAPQHVTEFMAIDFTALMHSGLLKQTIEGYTYLVERFPMEEVTPLLKQAIDKVIVGFKDEPSIQQEVAQHWFTFLERHSLFGAAEYLALKMLNDESCILDEKSTNLFEQYRKMANGKIAPNIDLDVEGSPVTDLRELDYKHNLEQKQKIIISTEELANETDLNRAFRELQALHKIWKEELGPVAKDYKDELWDRFSAATKVINDKRQDYYSQLEEKFEENLEVKNGIIAQIKAISEKTIHSHKDWQANIKKIETL